MFNQEPLEILLIEDNDLDADLTIRALRGYNLSNKIIRLCDGQEAMEYFFPSEINHGQKPNRHPKLILLDIKLPGIDGLEVLQALKDHESTKRIPVVMLTSSTEEKDIETCYRLGVNSYIPKPVGFENFLETMRTLGLYWLLLNKTP
jgi:two-component system, response regulator